MSKKQIHSLKIKIIFLLSFLIISVSVILSIIYIQNLNILVSSNITLFSKTMMQKEEKELQNKIDLAYNVLNMYYKKTTPTYIEEAVKKELNSHQDQLFNQLNNIYNIYKNKESTKKLQSRLKEVVKYARYSNNGYFWINDMNYKMIMHPIKPEYNKQTFIKTPLVPFVKLGVNTLKEKNKNSIFIKYKFYNPTTKKYEFKISLVRIFKPFNWVIGTGRYLSDVTPYIQQQALKDIQAFRYGENGYFWINDMNYKMIMHPIKPEYNSKVFINSIEVPFVSLGIDSLIKCKKDFTIIKYKFYNPSTKKYEDKLSVVKMFKPWGWVIGTGVYLDNINRSIKKVEENKYKEQSNFILKIILISCFIIVFILISAYYLTDKFIVMPMLLLSDEKKYFEEISQIDFLTNILNRRAFYQEIEKCFSYAKRNNLSVSVMMLDIDFFKKVNDTYGHEAGDKVLQTLSKIIQEIIREEDIFGRLGGEEFGLCVLNSNTDILYKIAQKIRFSVEKKNIIYKDKVIKITISIGAYNLDPNLEDFQEAFNKADKALYKAKETGRNKVELYK